MVAPKTKKAEALRNYFNNFDRIKNTRLQNRLNDFYERSEKNLEGYLRPIKNILGNRGLSYEERVERIRNWLNKLNEDNYFLTDFDKSCLCGMLNSARYYISDKGIKNKENVLRGIRELKEMFGFGYSKNNLESKAELGLSQDSFSQIHSETNINLTKQPYKIPKKESRFRKAGKALIKGIVCTLGGLGIIAVGSYFLGNYNGVKSQQPIIQQKQEIIDEQANRIKKEISACEVLSDIVKKKDAEIHELRREYGKANCENEILDIKNEVLTETNEGLVKKCSELESLYNDCKKSLPDFIGIEKEQPEIYAVEGPVFPTKPMDSKPKIKQKTAKPNPLKDVLNKILGAPNWVYEQGIGILGAGSETIRGNAVSLLKEGKFAEHNTFEKGWDDALDISRNVWGGIGWVANKGNQGARYLSMPVAGVCGATSETLRGNIESLLKEGCFAKHNTFMKGWEDAQKITDNIFKVTVGGESYLLFHGYLIQGDIDNALNQIYKEGENSLWGHTELSWVLFQDIIAGKWLRNHCHTSSSPGGGFERIGGMVGEAVRGGGALQ